MPPFQFMKLYLYPVQHITIVIFGVLLLTFSGSQLEIDQWLVISSDPDWEMHKDFNNTVDPENEEKEWNDQKLMDNSDLGIFDFMTTLLNFSIFIRAHQNLTLDIFSPPPETFYS